jgi:hypothetical protein
MKKTISIVLMFSFAFILVAQMPALAEDIVTTSATLTTTSIATSTIREGKKLEKISSPGKISLFEQIKKIGNDLFGVKKMESTKASSTRATSTKATSTRATSTLEKITSLNQVKLFEQIKKIGNDLFGVKKTNTYVLPTLTADSITCVSAAIDAKDTKISAALTTAATEITSAITDRGTCQKTALSATSESMSAINVCNKAFSTANKTANDKVKAVQKEAWTAYTASLKTCATNASTTEIKIEDGGQDVTSSLN